MKRRVIRFDQFLVWVFQMNKGDIKRFTAEEITRGLTTHGDKTMNSISVFTKGRFVTHRDGMPPLYSVPGSGGDRFVVANSLEGFALEALEDDSEYHCILPRDHEPRFWQRKVEKFEPGVYPITKAMIPNRFVYVAAGEVIINHTKVVEGKIARVKTLCDMTVLDDAIIASMWIDDAQV